MKLVIQQLMDQENKQVGGTPLFTDLLLTSMEVISARNWMFDEYLPLRQMLMLSG